MCKQATASTYTMCKQALPWKEQENIPNYVPQCLCQKEAIFHKKEYIVRCKMTANKLFFNSCKHSPQWIGK